MTNIQHDINTLQQVLNKIFESYATSSQLSNENIKTSIWNILHNLEKTTIAAINSLQSQLNTKNPNNTNT